MLSILRVLDQHRSPSPANVPIASTINKDLFKIIYVCVGFNRGGPVAYFSFSAPMKALASEIVRKLGKRLQWLSIQVRELTGNASMIARHFY